MENPIRDILKTFGENIGLEGVGLDEHGHCCLTFEDLVVNFFVNEEAETLLLFSPLGKIPAFNREVFFEGLLSANNHFNNTHGATLGVDVEEETVILSCMVSYNQMDFVSFENHLKPFVDTADSWKKKIRAFLEYNEKASAKVSDFSGMGMRV